MVANESWPRKVELMCVHKAMLTGEDQDEYDEVCTKEHFHLRSKELRKNAK